jgi:CIC family chloride channel protein
MAMAVRGRFLTKLQATSSRPSGAVSLIVSAVFIGTLTGLAAVGFDRLVHVMGTTIHEVRVTLGATWGPLVIVLIPALGALLITPIVTNWAVDVRGSGIPSVMLAVSNFGGRVAKRIILWRPLATTLSVGTGASLGTEGPVAQLGAAIASGVADIWQLNDAQRRNLVAVAAASGVAATFNAPIAGVLFSLEVILGQFTNRYFASVVIGAVSASAVSRLLLGDAPAFVVPDYTFDKYHHLPLYLLLGVVCGFLALLFIRTVVLCDDGFNRLRLPKWSRPMVGGLLVGVLGLFLPDLLGRGYNATESALQGDALSLPILLLLTFGKMLSTGISMASWGSGGVFAPVLMIGATSGDIVGQLAVRLLPDLAILPGSFALVGMGALFAGVSRAPMSSIMMIFEISGGYQLILPLLLAAVIATLIGDALHPESMYQVLLSRRGFSLLRSRESDLLQTVRVREIMDTDVPKLTIDDTIADLKNAFANSHHHGFILTRTDDPEHIAAIVTFSDMERARQQGLPETTPLRAISHKTVHCTLPDEPISDVLEAMAQRGISRMPVVDPSDRRKPIGYVRQSSVAKAYYQALQRQRQIEIDAKTRRLRELTGQDILEIRVRTDCAVAGKTLRELNLPKESIVVAIRRGGKTVFPHGDTRLEAGDTVVANVAPGFSQTFRQFFAPSKANKTLTDTTTNKATSSQTTRQQPS